MHEVDAASPFAFGAPFQVLFSGISFADPARGQSPFPRELPTQPASAADDEEPRAAPAEAFDLAPSGSACEEPQATPAKTPDLALSGSAGEDPQTPPDQSTTPTTPSSAREDSRTAPDPSTNPTTPSSSREADAGPAAEPRPSLPSTGAGRMLGSMGHEQGRCKPCAYSWRPSGCYKGSDCICCHLCTKEDYDRRRWTMKQARARRRRERCQRPTASLPSPLSSRSPSRQLYGVASVSAEELQWLQLQMSSPESTGTFPCGSARPLWEEQPDPQWLRLRMSSPESSGTFQCGATGPF
uniref:C3H1-type domain-containing protein n=1 Tax=Alexandrium monilatum TaxID=311494 RepID=A0A7S4RJX6_9DINO|mmetsp:Transcript_19251/g.57826  ORF Transcript_19251/g.57826 Transcript_19251/m.57826 type:complete len:297 (+) Transcript_19251:50-940(+)